MKRIFVLILSLILLVPNLAACGKDSIVGVWESSVDVSNLMTDSFESASSEFEDMFDFKDATLDFTVDFREDGTYSMNISKESLDNIVDVFVRELKKAIPKILELQYGMPLEDIIAASGQDMSPEEFIEANFTDEALRESVNIDYTENVEGTYIIEDDVFRCFYKIDDNRDMSFNTKFELNGDILYFENFVFPGSPEDSDENASSTPCTLTRKK